MTGLVKSVTKGVRESVRFMKSGSEDIAGAMGFKSLKGTWTNPKMPPVAALPDEEAIQRTMRRQLAARAGTSGRASTILTGNDEPLG